MNEQIEQRQTEEIQCEPGLAQEMAEMPATVDFAAIDHWLEESYPQMEQDLLNLLAFPSVQGEAGPGAPFGEAVSQALDYALEMARSMGLATENVDGYLGFADMAGSTPEQVGVLTHLDVVPANASDWQYAPFAPVKENDRIYGRGTQDDKGPLVASLYAGQALAKAGLRLNKTVRFMFGCNEESGFNCIRHYLTKYEPPACGFSPDGYFPLVIGEKGLAKFALGASWRAQQGQAPLRLVSIKSGTVVNVVPDRAEALLTLERDFAFEGTDLAGLNISRQGKYLRIQAQGKAAHASTPEQGENALALLLKALSRLDFAPRGAKEYVTTLAKLFDDSRYGESIGVADEDEYSRLTLVPSILAVDENQGLLNCDMRFTLTRRVAYFQEKIEAAARRNNLNLVEWQGTEPLFAGEDSPLATSLLQVYRDFSGDMSEPLIMGGGTYAKTMPNFLAFGMALPNDPHVAHQADEYIECRQWLDSAKIYARAIYELAK